VNRHACRFHVAGGEEARSEDRAYRSGPHTAQYNHCTNDERVREVASLVLLLIVLRAPELGGATR